MASKNSSQKSARPSAPTPPRERVRERGGSAKKPAKPTPSKTSPKSDTKAGKGVGKATPKPANALGKPSKSHAPPPKTGAKAGQRAASDEKRTTKSVPPAKPSKRDVGSAKGPASKRELARGSERDVGRKGSPTKDRLSGKLPSKPAPSFPTRRPSLPPPPPPPKPPSLEERHAALSARLAKADPGFLANYEARVDMSWIFHDSALEGVVYTEQELTLALDPNGAATALEAGILPVCEEIRRHKKALDFVRAQAKGEQQAEITIDLIKEIYLILHPEEGDVKTVKYRKDIPQHRLYFHEYAAPDKIAPRVRTVVDTINDPENRKSKGGLRFAARAHYDLLRVFPFTHDSGKVARMLLNLLLLRAGLPPAIIHMSERQRYYEALKGSPAAMNTIVTDAIDNNLKSVEKLLDQYDAKQSKRG